jgi:L-rhamnose-H+ transport protein
MSVFTGVLFHSAGASCAALCYTPQKKTRQWSWQTFWLLQAFFCWLLLPVIGAFITIPDLITVLHEAPAHSMWKAFLLGAAYGIGGTAFGIAIRFVGFSLTYAIAVGISCVLGTLLPPVVHGQLIMVFSKTGSAWVIAGIGIGVAGIALCGLAGRFKELDLEEHETGKQNFSLKTGLPLCLLAGVLSAVYGFALDQGQPIADTAAKYGAGNFQGNVIYIFSNSGAFVTTLIYCLHLHNKQKTFIEFTGLKKNNEPAGLLQNYLLAIFTGVLWYAQFFFYGLGHVRMGTYKFSSWAIHMIMLVLFSCIAGLLMKEWSYCKSRTAGVLVLALMVLAAAVLSLTYGNYLGDTAAVH